MNRRWPVPLLVACAFLAGCETRARIPEKVTTDRLLSLRSGMSYAEIEGIIGPPLCIGRIEDEKNPLTDAEKKLAHDLLMHCTPFNTARSVPPALLRADVLTVSYAEPSESDPLFDPDIYVTFHTGRFFSLYIKYQDYGICCTGFPDKPFYWIGSYDLLHRLIGR